MYEAFYSLDDSPFVLTPDPRFLLRSKGHHEILATLLYGVTSQKGLMALVGDVGTGKTTLCRALLRDLPDSVQSALVLNPHLSGVDLVATLLDDLGVERRPSATRGELMSALSQYLLAAGGAGKTVLVIVDEAQRMSVESLEQIRILSNLETATRKLVQILLVGQPELEEKLKLNELRQLDQRIGIRCYLKPLPRKETYRYVEHRMRIAGLPGALPFTRAALARIYKVSRGIPRVINLVCDRALMAGFSQRVREITPSLVATAVRNLEGGRHGRNRYTRVWARGGGLRRAALIAGLVVVLLGAGGAAGYWSVWRAEGLRATAGLHAAAIGASVAPPVAADVAPLAGGPSAPAVSAAAGLAQAPAALSAPSALSVEDSPALESQRRLTAQLLTLWGVADAAGGAATPPWPLTTDGNLDIPGVAARYQLAATYLPTTSLADLRAIGLPALVELADAPGRPHLLRWIGSDTATVIAPSGEEARFALNTLDPAWTRAAWIVWRNVDQLPIDPRQDLPPAALSAIALRLQKLGYLGPPVPSYFDSRFQQAVRRFQRSVGALHEDGTIGPRTVIALSRVADGDRSAPSIVEGSNR
ncbi:MAG TPA: AAA family ATPase [Candidatus Bathyarchaeia archaeon]|nr:AAA family ATPase [Candidatus Bathyarchaeia archaeon]